MTRSHLNRLLAPRLAECMSLQDAGEILGISRQRVHQLAPDRQHREPPPRTTKRRIDQVLPGIGYAKTFRLVGNHYVAQHAGPYEHAGAWTECQAWILCAAWLEGASVTDLSSITGWSLNQVRSRMVRMRQAGYPFHRRSPGHPSSTRWIEGPLKGQLVHNETLDTLQPT